MALRALELRKEIDAKTADLKKCEEKLAELQTRESDVVGRVEAATDETRELVEQEVNDFIDEKKSTTQEAESLRDAIAFLEKELEDLEAEQPSGQKENVERKIEKMPEILTRDSQQYIDAFARYIKSGNDKEVRALLTENVEGDVAVPSLVESTIKTAWERTEIMALVRKTYLRGNLRVGFEISGDPAVVHIEGEEAPDEEELTLGVVSLIPESIKKWITISDEVMDLGGEDFLRYIYDELTYRIAKKIEDILIAAIVASPAASTATAPGAAAVTLAPALGTIASAVANLSDEARNPVIIMNKLTYAEFKSAQYTANFAADPFEGLRVYFNNTLPAYSAATAGAVYMIVGDLGVGAQANFPNGRRIRIKFDDLSLAEADLIKLVGRSYVAIGVVAPYAFVNVKKPSSEE